MVSVPRKERPVRLSRACGLGFARGLSQTLLNPGQVVRVATVALWIAGIAGCGGVAVPAASPAPDSDVQVSESIGVVPPLLLPAELDGLHGQMTADVVDEQYLGKLGCERDVCGGAVPFVLEAAPDSTYSHYEFYFDVDGARPLYQVVGFPRAGWEPAPMVGLGMDSAGLSLRTGDGHAVRVQVMNGRVVWTWERAR
jgi:hypothetical protein